MKDYQTVVVAYGDGIGPEIMEATLAILKGAKARINVETIEIGEKVYLRGQSSGITKEAWEKVLKHKVMLKAPITTPQGKGYKSLNVTFRKTLGLYANIRPCISYYPYIGETNTKMDMVICRENEEDLYAGIEYKPTQSTAISHKLITRQGSEKIIKYAFEYARNNNRKKVTCLIKDNIMKIADGMFHTVFKEVAAEYKDIISDSIIVDIGSARIASRPSDFDVIVTLNLYGDIVSDIAAEVSGSIGLAGSSNIGTDFGMFEAVHGSAPDIAGKGIANPSGLLNGAVLMLEYLGQVDIAAKVKNAWLKTIEDGIHTGDIYNPSISTKKVTTHEFAQHVIANLGYGPKTLTKYNFKMPEQNKHSVVAQPKAKPPQKAKKLIGVDILLDVTGIDLASVISKLEDIHHNLKLHIILSKGLKIWPESSANIKDLELITCRFIGFKDVGLDMDMVNDLFKSIIVNKFDVTALHSLYTYDDEIGFTLAQGE